MIKKKKIKKTIYKSTQSVYNIVKSLNGKNPNSENQRAVVIG